MQKNELDITFNFFDLNFKPYTSDEGADSISIMKKCLQHINDVKLEGNAIVIDRAEGQKDSRKRNLFVNSAAIVLKDNKYKCKIALLRENRLPTLVNKKITH